MADRFLEQLSPASKQLVLASGRSVSYKRGAIVFCEGDASRAALVILSGELGIRRTSLDGHEIALATRAAGDLVGELAALDGRPRTATVHALSRAHILVIHQQKFRELAADHSEFEQALRNQLARRLRQASQFAFELATHDGLSRVCGRLVFLAEDQTTAEDHRPGHPIAVMIGSQQDLALSAGLQRAAVVKHLRQLRRLGWVDTQRGVVHIMNMDALRQRAPIAQLSTTATNS